MGLFLEGMDGLGGYGKGLGTAGKLFGMIWTISKRDIESDWNGS